MVTARVEREGVGQGVELLFVVPVVDVAFKDRFALAAQASEPAEVGILLLLALRHAAFDHGLG